jgi:TRAP-type C4-dicarboxylate transport system substrate-binding protein
MFKPLLAAMALGAAALAAPAQTAATAAKPSNAASSPASTADAPAPAAAITWDIATPFPETSFHTENLVQFAQEVERASEGKLKINIKPDGTLKADAVKRAVQNGKAPLGEIQLADVQSEWATFGLDSVPMLASGYAQARKLYQAQRVPIGKKLAGQGMVMLYSVPSPPPGLFLKKPVAKLTELRGLTWAAYSPATERMAKLVGAKPVSLPADHVAQAVTQGEVQAALVSTDGFNTDAFEPMEAFLDLQAWLPRHAVLMNVKAFEALDKPTRAAVIKAAIAAEQRGWKASEARHQRFLGLLKDLGMAVITPAEPLRTGLLKTVGEPMLDEWLQRTGPEGKLLIEDYRR